MEEVIESSGEMRAEPARRGGLLLRLWKGGGLAAPGERELAREEFEQQHPEAEDVGSGGYRLR